MAPALSVTPRESHAFDSAEEADKHIGQRRRALASVDNFATPMEEDDMGLQNQPSLAKDSQEMEQILVDLGNSDLAQADLLQAIKTFESGGDALSTVDGDAIFPLSGFDLADPADSEGDATEEKVRLMQGRLERRCAFLQRRLRLLQIRSLGKRISEEAAQTFEKCMKGARKDGAGRPVGLKAFLKRIETTATLQASAASRSVIGPKYYRTGTTKIDASKSVSKGISSGTLTGLEDTAGALRSHMSVVKRAIDSDATASSSGAESNDEAVTYNNPHQQHMPIEKRALWSWQKARASIASRWCWLQAQVQELEYKIRQHTDLQTQVREAKGPVELEGEPVAYEGSLPGSSEAPDGPETETCARVRPLRKETFKKRKLLQMHNLHIATNKAAKPTDIRCSCEYKKESCAVCTGRAEPTEPAPPACALAPAQRLARVDPAYHPVLSDIKDVSPSLHLSALASRSWFRARAGSRVAAARRPPRAAPPAPPAPPARPAPRAKPNPPRLKRGRPPLSRKIRERDREDETSTSSYERYRGRPSTESRPRRPSYDIDNIVIPQSVAASTRPQILTYKEIITPKWRVLEIPEVAMNNGISNSDPMSMESEEEDISDAAVLLRHVRAERRERGRYARKPRPRRNHDSDNSNNNSHGEAPGSSNNSHGEAPGSSNNSHAEAPGCSNNSYAEAPGCSNNSHAEAPGCSNNSHGEAPGSSNNSHGEAPGCSRNSHAEVPGSSNNVVELPALLQRYNNSHPPEPPEPGSSELETVRPYSPRRFPLPSPAYSAMLAAMPAGYRAPSPPPRARSPRSPRSPPAPDDDASTLSPLSVTAFDGDDPDDAEWEPSIVKTERRKSTFR